MRRMRMLNRVLLGGMLAIGAAACAPPGATEVGVSAEFGPGVDVYDYDPGYFGAWRTNYLEWTPTTVYVLNGRFYSNAVRGSRPVAVYRYRDHYFLPPRDHTWEHQDHRYDYRHQPQKKDYRHARPRAPEPGGHDNGHGGGRGGGHS